MHDSLRRQFLQQSLVTGASTALAAGLPCGWLHAVAAHAARQDRVLVVIQLSGGNDGLNTVVPYADEAYRRARPKLAISTDSLIKINDQLGLHPSLRALEPALADRSLSIVQGVGYPKPNRSHFESMDIWHTCKLKAERADGGWLGSWIGSQGTQASGNASLAMHLGSEQQPLALTARGVTVPSIASLAQFQLRVGDDGKSLKQQVMQLALNDASSNTLTPRAAEASEPTAAQSDLLDFVQSSNRTAMEASRRLETSTTQQRDAHFPETKLGEKLSIISQLITSDLPTRVYYVTLDGFDTHAQQSAAHGVLLRTWADALAALLSRLKERGHEDRVLVMTFSEFGRRLAENASEGTDHGAAAPVFLAGGRLTSSPVVGHHPSLSELDDGDVQHHTDFRSVYATIIQRWFGATESKNILGGEYPLLVA